MTSKLPEVVYVGPYALNVVVTEPPELNDADNPDMKLSGRLRLEDNAVLVSPSQSGVYLADTLLHEVLHAVWAVAGGWSWDIDEERVIYSMSTVLLDTLRRNPALVDFLVNI